MLALLAENEHLKQQLKLETENFMRNLAHQVLVNENLRRQNSVLSKKIKEKKQCAKTLSKMTVKTKERSNTSPNFAMFSF